MKLIPLTQGKFAKVSDVDFRRVNQHRWHAVEQRCGWYARRYIPTGTHQESMQKFILDDLACYTGDHRNGDGLDNQRSNLRKATRAQNGMAFRKPKRGFSSRFRGVTWNRKASRWQSYIAINKKPTYLGVFETEHEAARAYDRAAKRGAGQFAQLNFPQDNWPSSKI